MVFTAPLIKGSEKQLRYNEFVVYNTNQIRLKYLVKMKIHYSEQAIQAYSIPVSTPRQFNCNLSLNNVASYRFGNRDFGSYQNMSEASQFLLEKMEKMVEEMGKEMEKRPVTNKDDIAPRPKKSKTG